MAPLSAPKAGREVIPHFPEADLWLIIISGLPGCDSHRAPDLRHTNGVSWAEFSGRLLGSAMLVLAGPRVLRPGCVSVPLQWLFPQDREVLPAFLSRQLCLGSRSGQPTSALLGRKPDFCEQTAVAVAVKDDLTFLAIGAA
jgi:hypothetical protein